jgi:hypothetical protein
MLFSFDFLDDHDQRVIYDVEGKSSKKSPKLDGKKETEH